MIQDVGKVLMQRDSITVDDTPVEVMADGRQVRPAQGKKATTTAGSTAASADVPLMPRQASRGRGRVGLAGGRGRGRGGRGGLGAAGVAAARSTQAADSSESTSGSAASDANGADARGQDAFRAMLMKK